MNIKRYILGIDLGVGSVGLCCMELNKNNEPCRIIQVGSYIFPSVAGDMKKRRMARGLRRSIRRKKGRLNKIRSLFVEYGLMKKDDMDKLFSGQSSRYSSPFELKVKGLDNELSIDELFICLLHYAKNRGFKSNRKNKEKAKNTKSASEEQKLLWSINATQEALAEKKYTVSQYIINDSKFSGKIRNTTNDYRIGITRQMVQEEAERLLNKQVTFGVINNDFKDAYMSALLYQRSFSHGPDEPSPYHDPLRKMIGKCIFDGQERAPLCAPSYEKFILIDKLLNIRYYETNRNDKKKLTKEQIQAIYNKALKNKITYKIVEEVIGKKVNFCGLTLNKKDYKKCADKSNASPEIEMKEIIHEYKLSFVIFDLEITRFLINQLKKAGFRDIEEVVLDEIADLLSKFKSDDEIKNNIEAYEQLSKKDILFKQAVQEIDESKFKKFGKLSFNVLYKILPEMLNGYDYSESMKRCDFNHTNPKNTTDDFDELPPLFDALNVLDMTITNKSVIASLQESKRIINAVISKFGKPHAIHVELARELTKSDKEREEIVDEQMMNQLNKLEIKIQILNKYSHVFQSVRQIHHDDIIKYRLYHEQGGIDPYTLASSNDENNARIPEAKLFSEEFEIDHILPYSKTYNDTMSNKILVSVKANREKGNNVPMQVFEHAKGINKYIEWAKNLRNSKKKEYLLTSQITDEMVSDFSARSLNDTRYATKTLCKILKYYFPSIKVKSFNGVITSKLKGIWGLTNLKHSYENPNYRLKDDLSEELSELYKKLDLSIANDIDDTKVIDEIKLSIVKTKKEQDKKNRGNHLHHALDATIIACATDSLRRRVEIHEQYIRQKTNTNIEYRIPIFNPETGEFLQYEIKRHSSIDQVAYFDLTNNNDPKRFPLPYPEFREETILRIFERDKTDLRNKLCAFDNYSPIDRNNVYPLLVSHKFSKKENGRLHEATILGVAPSPKDKNISVLTNRMAINNSSFKATNLNKIYDKDGTQKQIYLAVKEWLGSYKDGSIAFAEHNQTYPKSNNGNEIKKVKIDYDTPKEEISLRGNNKQYVEKENVIQIHIYKKMNSDKLYFIGMDRYRVMNYKKDPHIMLWWGQGKNNIVLKYSELKNSDFVLYTKLYKNQIIELELVNGEKGFCRVVGFGSGLFEIGSILGDGLDLIHDKLQTKVKNQQQITVSTIKTIRIVSTNILGDII